MDEREGVFLTKESLERPCFFASHLGDLRCKFSDHESVKEDRRSIFSLRRGVKFVLLK
jgi:hypothetical protein